MSNDINTYSRTNINGEIGYELYRSRKKLKLTLNKVSNIIANTGITLSTSRLSAIESGDKNIDDEILEILCKIYNVNSQDLLITACKRHLAALISDTIELNEEDMLNTATHFSDDPLFNQILDVYSQIPDSKKPKILNLIKAFVL